MDHSHQGTKTKKTKFVQDDSPEPSSSGYQPPNGFKQLAYDAEAERFDWDVVNRDPNLEIWAIRLPLQLKPKYLDKMSFPLCQNSSTGGPIARISAGKKQTQYDITLASNSTGAEEMKGMTCLLPRRTRSGKLFVSQKPLAGHLLLSESPIAPVASTSVAQDELSTTASSAMPLLSSKRFSHPPHLLKHRYTPTSARRPNKRTIVADSDAAMREDSQRGQPVTFMEPDGTVSHPGSPTKSHKKRKKGEEELENERDKKGKKKRAQIDS